MNNSGFQDHEGLPVSNNQTQQKPQPPSHGTFGLLAWKELAQGFIGKHQTVVNYVLLALGALLYHAYFIYSIIRYKDTLAKSLVPVRLFRHIKNDIPMFGCKETAQDCGSVWSSGLEPPRPYWCDSIAFLIIITALAWICVIYGYVCTFSLPFCQPYRSSVFYILDS